MTEYYVIKNKDTGLYFRGKGVNRWGKYFNQASIYRIKGTAEHSVKEIAWHDEQAEVVPIQISEATYAEWYYDPNGMDWGLGAWKCSKCHTKNDNLGMGNDINPYMFAGSKFCPQCGAIMEPKEKNL